MNFNVKVQKLTGSSCGWNTMDDDEDIGDDDDDDDDKDKVRLN